MLRFDCPSCRTLLQIPDALAGTDGECPRCNAPITSPLVRKYTVVMDADQVVSNDPLPMRLAARPLANPVLLPPAHDLQRDPPPALPPPALLPPREIVWEEPDPVERRRDRERRWDDSRDEDCRDDWPATPRRRRQGMHPGMRHFLIAGAIIGACSVVIVVCAVIVLTRGSGDGVKGTGGNPPAKAVRAPRLGR